ncbi:MAG: phosphate acetyltransferase [Tenericutes bacterium]|nr:phosphate acetyltransferase [Mycoplasmatota bacterium]
MDFIEKIKLKAKQNKKTIVLPESMDNRVLKAAKIILEEEIANIILIGKEEIINKDNYLKKAIIIDPEKSTLTEKYINRLTELRKDKGMTKEFATKLLLEDYMYYACMLVLDSKADGIVSGACHSSSNTLRPALQLIKTATNTKFISSFFLMDIPNCNYGNNGLFIFADCGLNQNPNEEELAYIAYNSAKTYQELVEETPYVAMLSHSTKGSANHPDVDKVVNATKIAKEKYSEYKIDGEFQLDTAIIPEIAELKGVNSEVVGHANVLIFPNLDSGNIGYKLVERFAHAKAYGPLTQGMAKPVNDLSRGCSIDDIVGVVAITAVQAQNY